MPVLANRPMRVSNSDARRNEHWRFWRNCGLSRTSKLIARALRGIDVNSDRVENRGVQGPSSTGKSRFKPLTPPDCRSALFLAEFKSGNLIHSKPEFVTDPLP